VDDVAVIGVNHVDTPISLRERLSVPPADLPEALRRVRSVEGVTQAVIVSTCNRVELYVSVVGEGGGAGEGEGKSEGVLDRAARELCASRGVELEQVKDLLYRKEGPDAVRHLFEVACGLDSMVPGENEVFGQVKDAYLAAVDAGAAGTELSRLFQRAFKVTKDVRSRTGIARRNVSVGTVVADLARKVFGKLSGSEVVLVGAGEMAELVLKTLVSAAARPAVIVNRSVESARALASRYGGEAVGLGELEGAILRADILVTSAAASEPIVSAVHVGAAARARKGRPMLVVDLGVPRNVEGAAGDLDGVILYDIDDLQAVVAQNTAYRLEEADRAKTLVAEEVRKFAALARADDMSDSIVRLRAELKQIGESECRRTLARLGELSDEDRRELEQEVTQMAERIVAKMLHSPIKALKEEARAGNAAEMEALLRRLFGTR